MNQDRIDAMYAMAEQDVSPNERDIAQRMLADAGLWPRPEKAVEEKIVLDLAKMPWFMSWAEGFGAWAPTTGSSSVNATFSLRTSSGTSQHKADIVDDGNGHTRIRFGMI